MDGFALLYYLLIRKSLPLTKKKQKKTTHLTKSITVPCDLMYCELVVEQSRQDQDHSRNRYHHVYRISDVMNTFQWHLYSHIPYMQSTILKHPNRYPPSTLQNAPPHPKTHHHITHVSLVHTYTVHMYTWLCSDCQAKSDLLWFLIVWTSRNYMRFLLIRYKPHL